MESAGVDAHVGIQQNQHPLPLKNERGNADSNGGGGGRHTKVWMFQIKAMPAMCLSLSNTQMSGQSPVRAASQPPAAETALRCPCPLLPAEDAPASWAPLIGSSNSLIASVTGSQPCCDGGGQGVRPAVAGPWVSADRREQKGDSSAWWGYFQVPEGRFPWVGH